MPLFHLIIYYSKGIEPLLDNLFSFLRRKTDFFVGASPQIIEETVMKVIKKHAAISDKAEAEKKIAKEKEEKIKKQKLEEKKRKVDTETLLLDHRMIMIYSITNNNNQ